MHVSRMTGTVLTHGKTFVVPDVRTVHAAWDHLAINVACARVNPNLTVEDAAHTLLNVFKAYGRVVSHR